jgi:hypothetical protein
VAVLAGIGRPGTCREAASWVQLEVKGQTMTIRHNFIRFSLAEEKKQIQYISYHNMALLPAISLHQVSWCTSIYNMIQTLHYATNTALYIWQRDWQAKSQKTLCNVNFIMTQDWHIQTLSTHKKYITRLILHSQSVVFRWSVMP